MMAVTRERISLVHTHVTDALIRTGGNSVLPSQEQDHVLAQTCGEVCDLLTDWLASSEWAGHRPPGAATVEEAIPGRDDYARFLDQTLTDALCRFGLDVGDAKPMVESARAAVTRIARRHLPWRQRELFREADRRVRDLRAETCSLASRLATGGGHSGKEDGRRRARAVLKRVLGLLPAIALTMASVTPAQAETNLDAWAHDAARVVTTYFVAASAHPGLLIEPPQLSGPELGL